MTSKLSKLNPAQLQKFQSFINTKEEGGRTPLFLAADSDRQSCAIVLLQYGASTEEADMHKITPLGAAVKKGHVQMIKILLHYNANPNITIDGKTLVEWANTSIDQVDDRCEIIKLLLVHGCVVSDEVIDSLLENAPAEHKDLYKTTFDTARVERARRYTAVLSSFAPLPASADPTKKSPMDIISEFTSFENALE